MALTFTRAPVPAAGDTITSTQMAALALAFNDRLRSGLADGAYRILFYFYDLWRQVRRPDDSGLTFPSLGEFLEFYMHLDIDGTFAAWPEESPGDSEGANLANPVMAFVHGNPSVTSEGVRLGDLLTDGTFVIPTQTEQFWIYGNGQRGVVVPGGGSNAPAFTGAEALYRIVQPTAGPMGRGYGGFMPMPQRNDTPVCQPGPDEEFPIRNFNYHFSPLKPGLVDVYFVGNCPVDSPDYVADPSMVQYIVQFPFAYYIVQGNGVVTRLPVSDYLLLNQGSADIMKTDGEGLRRALNAFIKDYRGSDEQRSDADYTVEEFGFDFERFFNSQYFLAPNIGRYVDGVYIADYPTFVIDATSGTSIGTYANCFTDAPEGTTTATSRFYAEGFVCSGFYVSETLLQAECSLEFLNEDAIIRTVTLKPGQKIMAWIENPIRPFPLRVRLKTAATISAGGSIIVQFVEQQAYKPAIHDAYLVLRLMSTEGFVGENGVDGRGKDCTTAATFSDQYFELGMLYNGLKDAPGQPPANVTSNPVFDSMRALTRDCVRLVPRQQLIGYEVVDGKSILYLTRDRLATVDAFYNIAPSRTAIVSGEIEAGVRYVVRTVLVVYNRVTVQPNDTFLGVVDVTEFAGTGTVYEYEGIIPAARPEGTTNEWIMFEQLKAYHPSDTSGWKPYSYSDYFAMVERCQFMNSRLPDFEGADLLTHFNYNSTEAISPEAPTGWRYALGTNDVTTFEEETKKDFYRSCRIYETPMEIESATTYFEELTEVVKLVFKTRFHHSRTAPDSIARDTSTWDIPALRAEPYRSTENAIREYLLDGPDSRCSVKVGDNAAQSDVQTNPDNPFGSCYPHLCFVHLVPAPYIDTNDTQETTDTKCVVDPLIQCEIYLRAMCEGYIDERSNLSLGCSLELGSASALWDYTFENLCFDAFNDRWISMMPDATRTDKPQGFGPLPNTYMYAEVFGKIAKCVNKLTRARLMLPHRITCKNDNYIGSNDIAADWPPGNLCDAGAQKSVFLGASAPGIGTLSSSGDWDECSSLVALCAVSVTECGSGGNYALTRSSNILNYEVEFLDSDAMEAIPEVLQSLISENGTGVMGFVSEGLGYNVGTLTHVEADAHVCTTSSGDVKFWDGSEGYKFEGQSGSDFYCQLFNSGSLIADPPPDSDYIFGRFAEAVPPCLSGSQRILTVGFNPDLPAFFVVPLV